MGIILTVRENDGIEHTIRDTGTGRLHLTISHPNDTPMFGRLNRTQALQIMDELDQMCNEGQAKLVFMDDEAYVNYRHGL